MPVTHQIIGTWITERLSTQVSGPCGEEEIAALRSIMENAAQTSTFEAMVAECEASYHAVLAKAQLPPWEKTVRVHPDSNRSWTDDLPEDWWQRIQVTSSEDPYQGYHAVFAPGEFPADAQYIAELRHGKDSQEYYAAALLQKIDCVRRCIAEGATESVAHFALALGIKMAITDIKFRWESYALLGKDTRVKRQRANEESQKTRRHSKQERVNKVRSKAIALWKNDTPIEIKKTADCIAKECSLNPHTVRGDLAKPSEWYPSYPSKQKI